MIGGRFMLFYNFSRNELGKNSLRPNMNWGRKLHKMNRERHRGKRRKQAKGDGGGRGRVPRKRPADAPRGRAPRTHVTEGRAPRRDAPALANGHVSWQQRAFHHHLHRKGSVRGLGLERARLRPARFAGLGSADGTQLFLPRRN